jgi:hypothetical protein
MLTFGCFSCKPHRLLQLCTLYLAFLASLFYSPASFFFSSSAYVEGCKESDAKVGDCTRKMLTFARTGLEPFRVPSAGIFCLYLGEKIKRR